jgi:hypothetical protein
MCHACLCSESVHVAVTYNHQGFLAWGPRVAYIPNMILKICVTHVSVVKVFMLKLLIIYQRFLASGPRVAYISNTILEHFCYTDASVVSVFMLKVLTISLGS